MRWRESSVKPVSGPTATDRAVEIVASIRDRGVTLWAENGRLCFKGPKGSLDESDREVLRSSKEQILALLRLDTTEVARVDFAHAAAIKRSPLSFSQLAHWNLYNLRHEPAIRHIASATRLWGPFDRDAFQKSVQEAICRHEALRTRIVVIDEVPMQEIVEAYEYKVHVVDYSGLCEPERQARVQEEIEQLVLEPINVSVGPLFGLRVLRTDSQAHILIMALEHIVSDMFSIGLLRREIITAYRQQISGGGISLAPVTLQFSDYAAQQRRAEVRWIEEHGAYWRERLAGLRRLSFPDQRSIERSSKVGWGNVPVRIGGSFNTGLRQWCRRNRTTLSMGMLVMYVGFVLIWCRANDGVIQYVSDGRTAPGMDGAIGFFASILFLRVRLHEEDTVADLLERVSQEYFNAYKHADHYYFGAQLPRPELTRNAMFNFVPQALDDDALCLDQSQAGLTCDDVEFTSPMLKDLDLDHDPMLVLQDRGIQIVGDVLFPLSQLSYPTMERFARGLMEFMEALISTPIRRLVDAYQESCRNGE